MHTLQTCLWFDTQAEEAANFYAQVFSEFGYPAKVMGKDYYPKASEEVSGKPAGSVMTVPFSIAGMEFLALNGGPNFKFTEAVSIIVNCKDQAEIDYFWEKLSAVPASEQCGWLKDKYGLSWQIVPENYNAIAARNPEKVMAAMLEMKKLIVADLEKAAEA